MESHHATIIRSLWATSTDAQRTEMVRTVNELANAPPPRPELTFEDDRRIVRWDGGHVQFSLKAILRFRLVQELYFSETGQLSAAEIGDLLYGDDLKDWDAIRVLGGKTENLNLEPARCPYMIEVEKQGLKILNRCEPLSVRVSQ